MMTNPAEKDGTVVSSGVLFKLKLLFELQVINVEIN